MEPTHCLFAAQCFMLAAPPLHAPPGIAWPPFNFLPLLRLQNLRDLTLDACSSIRLLGQLLGLCTHLPHLVRLRLSYWGMEALEQRQQMQHSHTAAAARQQQQQQQQQQCLQQSLKEHDQSVSGGQAVCGEGTLLRPSAEDVGGETMACRALLGHSVHASMCVCVRAHEHARYGCLMYVHLTSMQRFLLGQHHVAHCLGYMCMHSRGYMWTLCW